jgi:predicted RNA-binding Zn-ribbon protein involved in translation (DUF1610 family)
VTGEYIDDECDEPMCERCEDVCMKETETGYKCPNCGFWVVWDEETGIWYTQAKQDNQNTR